ncbi:MAG: glycosyltransferase family 2 protein [Chloroflexi bacterium]|nr:glycosyltransferase family 2 protein [Chloroflexota bacterium]
MPKQFSETANDGQSIADALPISVIIPTYNRAHLVPRAIESALAQTKRPSEIIVVDDGSQDNTQEQAAAFGNQIRYLRQQNSGAATARHTGVQAATSKWIAFLDSDDYWESDHLERMARVITATEGQAALYFADTMVHAPSGNQSYWAQRGFAISEEYELRADATNWALLPGQPMLLQSSVINRDAYFAVGGFWTSIRNREDTHLFYKLGLGGTACAVAGIGAHLMDDDAQENRLSLSLDMRPKQRHTSRVLIYKELLSRDLAPPTRREIRRRLALAHFRLSRLHMITREWKTAVSHLWRSLTINPQVTLARIRKHEQTG